MNRELTQEIEALDLTTEGNQLYFNNQKVGTVAKTGDKWRVSLRGMNSVLAKDTKQIVNLIKRWKNKQKGG